jgi:hypothetical protein
VAKNCNDKFPEIKKFVNIMGDHFRPIQVMKIKIEDAKWLVEEVERLREELQVERDSALLEVIEEAFGQRLGRNAEKYAQILREKFGEVEDE